MPLLVIDTNVVLEWLWFRDPRCDALAHAVGIGQVRWIASAAMHDELAHVLARGIKAGPPVDPGVVMQGWQRWVLPTEPDARPTPPGLRCTDTDDQKFIDLAWQAGASTLLSRDRAVLRLARRARALGLWIGDVEAWQRSRRVDRVAPYPGTSVPGQQVSREIAAAISAAGGRGWG